MKFGDELRREMVAEWEEMYLRYEHISDSIESRESALHDKEGEGSRHATWDVQLDAGGKVVLESPVKCARDSFDMIIEDLHMVNEFFCEQGRVFAAKCGAILEIVEASTDPHFGSKPATSEHQLAQYLVSEMHYASGITCLSNFNFSSLTGKVLPPDQIRTAIQILSVVMPTKQHLYASEQQQQQQQQQQQRNDRDSSLNNNNKTSKPTITTIQEQQKCLAAVPAVSNNRTTSRLSLNVASPAMQRQASNGGDGGQSKRAGEVGYGYGHGHDATGHQGVKEFPVLDSHMHVHNVWKAFVEVYRQGVYVKEYARVNEKAFAKILKKFDKHFHQDLSSTILPLIESEYCFCGKHLSQLVSAMENVWTKHHTHEPHHGMHTLREVKDFSRRFWNVRDSFWVGLVIGIALALGAVVLSRVPSVNILSCDFSAGVAMLRAFLLAVIAVWLWGVTVHVWQQSFHPYRTILDLPCAISVPHTFQWAATGSVSCAVSMYILVRVTGYGHSTPHDTVWGAVLVAVCGAWCGVPRIITRHARCLYRRIAVLLARAVLLPQRKVTIAEEWMVEQLMCLGVVSSDIVHCLCYLFADSYRNTHHCVDHHIWVRGIIFALPSVLRLGQCVRKLRTSDTLHARYTHVTRACFCILSIAITVFSSIFSHVHYKSLFGLWAVLAVVTVVGISAWDVHHDWGFFTTPKNSPDWPLRQGLSMFPKQRAPYYAMAVTNLVLRVAWVWNITNDFGWIENEVFWKFIAAGLELLRRCQWSMVSMEHLHNTHHTTPRKQQSKAINTAFAFGVHTKHVTSSAQLQPGPRAFWSASPPRSARDAPISEIVISVPHLSDRGATTFESIDSVAPLLPSSMHSAT